MVEALRKLATRRVEGLELLSDEAIVAMCQRELPGDVTAFREILRRYEPMVFSTCSRMIGNPIDAEEVAQDALLQVFHKIHKFEGRSSFKTWLYTIVMNYCKNRVTKIIRKREGSEAYEEHSKVAQDTPENTTAEDTSASVEDAISKLPEQEREVLVMKFMSGLTLQEMSDVLEIGLSATKMRLYRAMESFKKVFNSIQTQA